MIELLDAHIRWVAVGAGLMLLLGILTGQARREMKLALTGLLVGAICYLLNETPLGASDSPSDALIDLFSLLTPFWTWVFARLLFEHVPSLKAAISFAAILCFSWFFGNYIDSSRGIGFTIIHVVSLILMADLVRVAFRDRADDLIEKRRVIRLVLPLLIAALAASILTFEMIVGAAIPYPAVQLANAVLILTLILFAGIVLFRTDTELLMQTVADTPLQENIGSDLSPSETVLNDKLTAAMSGGYYREPGLTIAGLAEHLETPEHRLRALINQRLGHRNFSAFLNRHRIAEAKQRLADRGEVDLPVLTIAMDLGYNSLPTFNRAFRNETGTTPSEFRRLAIKDEAGQK